MYIYIYIYIYIMLYICTILAQDGIKLALLEVAAQYSVLACGACL